MKSSILLLWLFNSCLFPAAPVAGHRQYESIFNLGDSLSDTGNLLLSGTLVFPVIGKLPYGETFFKKATGRCSDGRLIVDFIAEAFKLPYLPPYLSLKRGRHDIKHGVNFAVAGTTAMDPKFFFDMNIGSLLWSNDSLNVQIQWFKNLKPSLCKTKLDCDGYFKKSLFLVGQIGGNDYSAISFTGGSIQDLQALVPLVVGTIMNATVVLIEEGATELVVAGHFPMGCSPVYLTLFQSANKEDYDQNGCLKIFNELAKYHNMKLKKGIEMVRQKFPRARIVYADYYGAAMRFVHAPKHFGFYNGTLRACCGGGGPYNFNNSARCGFVGSEACEDPSSYSNWDGIHLTEAAHRIIAKGLLDGPFSSPPILTYPLPYN